VPPLPLAPPPLPALPLALPPLPAAPADPPDPSLHAPEPTVAPTTSIQSQQFDRISDRIPAFGIVDLPRTRHGEDAPRFSAVQDASGGNRPI
jgi:hypothetical protein